VFKQLKSEKLSEKVSQEIIKLIESGELKPGDRLPAENIFAEQLGVSRGILREALMLLQYQGFISRKPKDGTYIRELYHYNNFSDSILKSLKNATYQDLIELREPLERKIVELAIERATDKEIKDVEKCLDIPLESNNYHEMDHKFHLKVAELSKNILLINFIDSYYGLIEELGSMSNKNSERRLEIIGEHKNIISSIMNRNVLDSKAAITYHLSKVKKSIDINK
jgi:GntR family transcriptional regulator, transcriptional repressor for pyruvate dehydrogenase complex